MPYTFCEQIGKEIRDISDEIPFEIPENWEWTRLCSISKMITKGTTPRGGNVAYLDDGIGFLRAENVAGYDKLDKSSLKFIDNNTHNNYLKRSIIDENDILITIAGTLGRTGLVRKNDLPLNANQAVSMVRLVNIDNINLLYLVYGLNSPLIQTRLTLQKKITAIPNLTLEIIADCLIPFPPLAEQKRIVEKIEQLLPFIEKYEQVETQLTTLNTSFPEMLKKSILQEAVQGKLVPQNSDDEPASVLLERIRAEKQKLIKAGKIKKSKHESVIITRDKIPYELVDGKECCIADEVPFEIPESWCWCRLKTLGVFSSGKTPSMSEPSFWNGTIPWVSSKDMKKSIIIDSEMHITSLAAESMQIYPAGTLLLVARSGILRRLLPLCVLGVDSTINQDIKAFTLYDLSLSAWLYYAIKAFEPYILKELVKSITTVESLKFDEFASMLIPIPPFNEQQQIIESIKKSIKLLSSLVNDTMFML